MDKLVIRLKKTKSQKSNKSKDGKKGKKKDKKKPKKDKKSLKSKKSKKKTNAPKRILKFTIAGEAFITNPRLCIYGLENNDPAIRNGYLLISTEKLFTRLQEIKLKPLIVSIDSLKNIPVDILSKHG